jgi:hypothetical protein
MLNSIHSVTASVNTPRHAEPASLEDMTAGERLARLLAARGIESAAELGRLCGLKDGTVRQHLNRGSIGAKSAETYARALKCSVDWLLFGRGPAPVLDVDEYPSRAPPAAADVLRLGVAEDPPPGIGDTPFAGGPVGAPRPNSIVADLQQIDREIDRLEERLRAIRERLGSV